MTNGSQYFPHEYAATNDPKIQALIGEYGAAGYGIYWRIVEMLHSANSHTLPLKKYIYLAIAKQMLTNAEQIEAMLTACINDYELINSDGVNFWIDRVLRNIETRQEISVKRREAGRLGAEKRKELAIAKQNQANKRKRKKRKDINTEIPTQINGFKKIPHLSDFYSQQIHVADLYEKENPSAEPDVKEYKKFIAYLYDYTNIDKVDPAGLPLCRPRKTLLEIRDQLRFIDFVKQSRKAKEIGVNIYEKIDAMENSPTVRGRLDFDKTMTNWLKPFKK